MYILVYIDLSTLLTFSKCQKIFFVIFHSKKYLFRRRIFVKWCESIVFNKRMFIFAYTEIKTNFDCRGGKKQTNIV